MMRILRKPWDTETRGGLLAVDRLDDGTFRLVWVSGKIAGTGYRTHRAALRAAEAFVRSRKAAICERI